MVKRLSYDELDQLSQELASFARSDIPMQEGLRQLSKSLESPRLRRLTEEAADHLEQGKSLSESLVASSFEVPKHFLAVLECADTSGNARSILEFAVDHSRRLKKFRTTMLTATLYPVLVVFVLAAVCLFMGTKILPKFVDIFHQLGAELPPLSLLILDVFSLFSGSSGILLVMLVAVIGLSILLLPRVQDFLFDLVSHVPGLVSLTVLNDTAITMRTLSVMLPRNIPASTALRAASLAVSRDRIRQSLEQMADAGDRGQRLSSSLCGDFPSTAAYLFSNAEERGDLAKSCEGIAQYCEDRYDRLSARALALFEPILICLVAILVGIFVVGLYLPLFQIPRVVG